MPRCVPWIALCLALCAAPGRSSEIDDLLAIIKKVGREGAGNAEARKAIQELTKKGPAVLPDILAALDDADPTAANWLRNAVDAVADRALAAGQKLPADRLEAFLRDTKHAGHARRLAYEWLVRLDLTTPDRLLPGMLDDPGAELRREAVAVVMKRAQQLYDAKDKQAKALFQQAFTAARDRDQVKLCVERLKALGEAVNLTKHMGFITHWVLAGPFDNTDGIPFDTVYAPERGVDLQATYQGKGGKKIGWKEYVHQEKPGLVNPDQLGIIYFNKAVGKLKGVTGYAFTVVESPEERPAEIRIGTFNAVKIFLNGKMLFAREEYHHGMQADQYIARGNLKKGRNEILVKVYQNEQTETFAEEWSFQLRITDALGGAVPLTDPANRLRKLPGDNLPGEEEGAPPGSLRSRFAAFLICPTLALATDWPQFRGPGGQGIAREKSYPVTWGEKENIRWKADLPGRGVSSPVVAGGRVYVTACSGFEEKRLHVLCLDEATGKKMWERQLWATGTTMCHPMTCMAAPTPATDGERIIALFATWDLACFDRAGNLLWYRALTRDYPTVSNNVGAAASPVLWKDSVFLPVENAGESFLLAVDADTGRNRWKVPRPRGINWTTPVVAELNGRAELLLHSPDAGLTAFDPKTGSKRWSIKGKHMGEVPTAVVGDGLVFVPGSPFEAVKPGVSQEKPKQVWKSSRLPTGFASPLYDQGRVYAVDGKAVVNCVDAVSGKHLWSERLEGSVHASPLLAGGKIYVVNSEGTTFVLDPNAPARLVAENTLPLKDVLASPAAANGAIYLRSDSAMYCIGGNKRTN
jgi:outer membrane protein assembly factor BamB